MTLELHDPEAIARSLRNGLAGSELEFLCDNLGHAAEGCDYAANDYGERADFEEGPNGTEEERADYQDAHDSYTATAEKLREIISEIRKQESEEEED